MDLSSIIGGGGAARGILPSGVAIRSRFAPTFTLPIATDPATGQPVQPSPFSFVGLSHLTLETRGGALGNQVVYSPAGPPDQDGDLFPLVLAGAAGLLYVGGKVAKYGLAAGLAYFLWTQTQGGQAGQVGP
jgi:hypothetical protein